MLKASSPFFQRSSPDTCRKSRVNGYRKMCGRDKAQTHQNTTSSQTQHCGALHSDLEEHHQARFLTIKLYQDLRFCIDPLSGP